jgi:hypothetical protein
MGVEVQDVHSRSLHDTGVFGFCFGKVVDIVGQQ